MFRPKYENWPHRIERVLQDLDLWLIGEAIDYMQVSHSVSDEDLDLAENAHELRFFALNEHFAVLVVIPRSEERVFGAHTRHQVARDRLKELHSSLPPLKGLFEGLTFELTYDGFPQTVSVKPSNSSYEQANYVADREFFKKLRDDLYSEPSVRLRRPRADNATVVRAFE